MMKEWHKKALELHIRGLSGRKIATRIGMGKSQVNDYLRKFKKNPELLQTTEPPSKPKILLYDLETSLIKGYFWGLWKQNISIDAIIDDWYVICWSAKWLGSDEMMNSSVHDFHLIPYRQNESSVILKLWKLVDEADILIAYNGKKFDRKKMNAKFLEYGLPEPSPYKVIDPMLICKGNFALTSNKMDFVVKYVNDIEEGKLKTNLQLWIDSMNDDTSALDRMQEYCDEDINVLERVYMAVRHWDKNAPNLALHYDDNEPRCNACASTDLSPIPNKTHNTNLSRFSIVRCNNCQKILRTRENILSKEKKQSLLMNA